MWIDQSLTQLCTSNRHYVEPDEIKLEPAFKKEYLRHFRWVMVRRLRGLLEKKKNDFRNEVESFILKKHKELQG